MQIKYIGYIVLGVVFVFVGIYFGPQLYFSGKLPSEEVLNKSPSISEAFSDWSVKSNSAILQTSQLPSVAFKCSVCYPDSSDSSQCKEKMASWIARNVLSDGESSGMLSWHLKNFSLGKAIMSKYDDSMMLRLFLTFSGPALNTTDINQYCIQKFSKSCSELEASQAVDLEVDIRKGQNNVALDNLRNEIKSACNK